MHDELWEESGRLVRVAAAAAARGGQTHVSDCRCERCAFKRGKDDGMVAEERAMGGRGEGYIHTVPVYVVGDDGDWGRIYGLGPRPKVDAWGRFCSV